MSTRHQYTANERSSTFTATGAPRAAPGVPDQDGEFCHCVFLDRIVVADGVCRKQVIRTAQDMVNGDEYRFPGGGHYSPSNIYLDGEDATIAIGAMVEVGTTLVRARRTHRIVLMSGNGHVLLADLLITAGNRCLLTLREAVRMHEDYALISQEPTR